MGGTLRNRMRGTPAEGNVHAKTGSMTGVTALSGYVTTADGRRLVFSFLQNNFVAGSPQSLEDAVVVRLAADRARHRWRSPVWRNGTHPTWSAAGPSRAEAGALLDGRQRFGVPSAYR